MTSVYEDQRSPGKKEYRDYFINEPAGESGWVIETKCGCRIADYRTEAEAKEGIDDCWRPRNRNMNRLWASL